jgi:hypothetical protein
MRSIPWALAASGLLAGALLALPGPAPSRQSAAAAELTYSAVVPRLPARGMSVGLDVLVDGRQLRTVAHEGKVYLPVPCWGTEYVIRVRNNGPRRVEAVVSVDGLSVISGRPASEEQRGYLVDPYSEILIKGWRRSRDTVAAFTFEDRDQSYASRMGHPENVGVIGLVAFEEEIVALRPELKAEADAPAVRRADGAVGGTGTGYGRDVDSPVQYVPFVRGANRQTVTLYYDTADALRKAGVPVPTPYPRPFPRDPEFAPPPPGDPRR